MGLALRALELSDNRGLRAISSRLTVPVSARLHVRHGDALEDAFNRTLSLVDRAHYIRRFVHGSIVASTNNSTLLGSFDPTTHDIRIYAHGPDVEFTLLHELGHYIDYSVLGTGLVGASSTLRFRPWRAAVRNSAAFRMIESRYTDPVVWARGRPVVAADSFTDYHLRPDELFARSYAQWIVDRSGDVDLTAQLESSPSLASATPVLYPTQWEEADFLRVAGCIDRVFKELSWSRS